MNPADLISGKYRLERPLGAGGMGSVWAARNELTNRNFAIKFLLPSLAGSQEAVQRFFQEARACGQIRHPAVVDVYDVGRAEDGSPYLVMEMLEGEGLDRRLKRGGPLPPTEAAALIAFAARGLEEAHVRGLVHRDLKPGNLFLCRDASSEITPKILDFGISKATSPQGLELIRTMTGMVLGSPAYMSPEQAKGEEEIDGRSDVWSLGIILYEALTGRLPFSGANYNALMVEILSTPHPPLSAAAPDVPQELAAVVDRALVKDRCRRIGTARELAERLDAVLATLPPPSLQPYQLKGAPDSGPSRTASVQGTWSASRPPPPRSPSGVLWVAVVMTSALLGASATALLELRPQPAPVAARAAMRVTASLARALRDVAEMKAQTVTEQRTQPPRAPHGGIEARGF